MKRSWLKRKSGFKQKLTKPMRRTRLRVAGVSTTAQDKQAIQNKVRLIVVYRDGGCILRNLRCGVTAYVEDGKVIGTAIIQADHLVTRSFSATFADSRLIVCLCKGCHMWKKYHEKEYEALVRTIISEDRIKLWDKSEEARQAHRTWKPDWKLAILLLEKELKQYERN